MYCEKCGNELKNGKCEKCEIGVDKKETSKGLSIVGLIFSFLVPIVGLVLSIIALIKGSKIQKQTGEKNKYLVMNIIGIVASIIVSILTFVLLIVIFAYSIIGYASKDLAGNWQCTNSGLLTNSVVDAEFTKSKKFIWSSPVDDKNYISGKYSVSDVQVDNNLKKLSIKINVDKYMLNGNETKPKTDEIIMTAYLNKGSVNQMRLYVSSTGKTFTCTRK